MEILRSQTGKRTESDRDRKNVQEVMINITIVKFPVIPGYDCGKMKGQKTFVL